jgi:cytochrome c
VTKLFLRRRVPHIVAAWLLLVPCIGAPMARAGDAAAGKKVFRSECAECHSVREGRNKKGPSLFGIVGRRAGALSNYR